MSGTGSPAAPTDGLRRVPCPTCKGPAVFHSSNSWRPFCSERCRTADLGAWASERFRVPGDAPSDDDPNVPSAP